VARAGFAGAATFVAAACGAPAAAPGGAESAPSPVRAPATVQVWEHRLFKWREDVGKEITLFNDRAVEALTWLKKIVDIQGGWQAIDAFRNSFPDRNGYTVFMGGGATYYVETLSERGEQFNIKAPTMKIAVGTFPLPDRGGRMASLGGCHAFPIAKGSKSPEAAWQFVEHVTNPENNIKFAARFDRVPIRESSCASPAYQQGDKGRIVQCQEMKARKFWLEVPGGGELIPFQDPSTPFMTGQLSVQDALKENERKGQEVLDKWSERARLVNP
jgi:ABC-type glycerol-3-phosphate transport system substrate-binding protein